MSALPDRPSELIRVALDDLRKVERDEHYEVKMGIWHFRDPGRPCAVCLAAAVMAKTLGLGIGPMGRWASPGSFPEEKHKLMALDWFRMGEVGVGLRSMGLDRRMRPLDQHVVPIPRYEDDREGFHAALRAMADELKEAGL